MFDLSNIYKPITANPFKSSYIEIPACNLLKPYIRCFWGGIGVSSGSTDSIVIPDTCMDIIFDIDYTENKVYGEFCGINDSAFILHSDMCNNLRSCFAIRMYAWAVPMFSGISMSRVKNIFCSVEEYFPYFGDEFKQRLFEVTDIYERKELAEKILLKNLLANKYNNDILNSLYYIFLNNGATSVNDIAEYSCISKRQLERKFLEYIGLSPKKMNNLIRYQLLWKDILFSNNFNIGKAVEKFGYFDQAHLLNDFKKYHLLSISEAKRNLLL